ncbi:MAG: TIGR03936 family radical SAM-associated protein [Clostridium sp.]
MRYLIKFTKESEIKFISHLDLMRTIQKVIRRADLPIEYSKGFHPHMSLSIAQPLSVGVYSEGEYMDIVLVNEMNETEIISKLNEYSAKGIKFVTATMIPAPKPNEKKIPQGMALVDAARYTIRMQYENNANLIEEVDSLMKKQEWVMLKKSKKGEKEVDIKPLVQEIKYWEKDNELVINALISSGSRDHLSPDLLATMIAKDTTGFVEDSFVNIKREEMYFLSGKKLLPLYKIV